MIGKQLVISDPLSPHPPPHHPLKGSLPKTIKEQPESTEYNWRK